jgi:hypothetical protein
MIKSQQRSILTRRAARFWRGHGWLMMALLWAAALILGYVGLDRNTPGAGEPGRFLNLAYRTLQLVAMEAGDVPAANWQLNTARFLLPILAAWTAVRALMSLFRDRWQQILVRVWSEHVVICGLSRKGWLLAQGFVARGERVVVIESDESHDMIGPCQERGMAVLVGDATDPEQLHRAGVQRARHLVAVTDNDGINAEIAVRAQGVLMEAAASRRRRAGRRYPLTCTVHLVDPQLHGLARTREMTLQEGVPLRLELFNVFDHAARLLWNQFGPAGRSVDAPAPAQGVGAECSAHVLVAGFGRLGESLVVCAARDWHTRLHEQPERPPGRLRIGVVDGDAGWKCQALELRYARLAAVCELVPWTMNVDGPEFYEGAFLAGGPGFPPVGAVFICFDDDSLGLRTGLAIHQQLLRSSGTPPPVVVRMAEAGGLARLLNGSGSGGTFSNLHAFAVLDSTCTPEAILGGTHEVLARALHQIYADQQRAVGHTGATNPSLVEWDRLPEDLRESNRAEADGILSHLATAGYTLVPLTDWDAGFFRFSQPEVEHLAEREHDRFVAERLGQGWRSAVQPKDPKSKRSPALVAWAQLSEEERAKNRDTVLQLPATLAQAGFQIVRLPSVGRASALVAMSGDLPPGGESERRELMARAIHERYRENQRGTKASDDPAMQPWEVLSEPLRESNRQQVDNIKRTLARIGCGMRSASSPPPEAVNFTSEEVEAMAAVAHEQWVAERRRAGWIGGPERDPARQVSPYLDAGYADLPEEVKEWDRQAVQAIPEVLAAAGLEVVRLG